MTDEQAETIIDGFRYGALDALDLRCIAADYGQWLAESDTPLAATLRAEARTLPPTSPTSSSRKNPTP